MLMKPLGVPYVDKKIQNRFRFGSWALNSRNVWHLYNESKYILGMQLVNDLIYKRFCYILYRKHCSFHDAFRFPEDVIWHSYAETKKSGLTICPICAKIWKEQYGKAYKELQKKQREIGQKRAEELRREKAKEPSWRDC